MVLKRPFTETVTPELIDLIRTFLGSTLTANSSMFSRCCRYLLTAEETAGSLTGRVDGWTEG